MKIPFKTNRSAGNENIMIVRDLNLDEIIFNRTTKEISLVCYDTYTLKDLYGISYQDIKRLVIDNKGEWTTKKAGIKFLIGKDK